MSKQTYESKPKVAFVCVHNSCRSQMAEALGKLLASDVFESYSAGTKLKKQINPDAVRLMKQIYGIDMEETQYNKLLSDIPKPDVVITMGCNVTCPCVPGQYTEDWGLEDPTGKGDEEFLKVINSIEEKVRCKIRKKKKGRGGSGCYLSELECFLQTDCWHGRCIVSVCCI